MEFGNTEIKTVESALHGMAKAYSDYAKAFGLSYMALVMLERISWHPDGVTQKVLCEETFYNKQSVNSIINAFYKEKYISFSEMDSDRRQKLIKFTDLGHAFAEKVLGDLRKLELECAEHLPEDEAKKLMATVNMFKNEINEKINTYLACVKAGNI